METQSYLWNLACNRFRRAQSLGTFATSKGQALVEFTLVFMLLLVVAWIPADFGLAFYTGQIALNTSREGARIAAADPCLAGTKVSAGCTTVGIPAQTGSCTMPCSGEPAGSVLSETAKRAGSALMPGATIRVCYPVTSVNPVNPDGTCNSPVGGGGTCNAQLAVTIRGDYNYTFFAFLRFFGASVPPTVEIMRATQMRWEHQGACT